MEELVDNISKYLQTKQEIEEIENGSSTTKIDTLDWLRKDKQSKLERIVTLLHNQHQYEELWKLRREEPHNYKQNFDRVIYEALMGVNEWWRKSKTVEILAKLINHWDDDNRIYLKILRDFGDKLNQIPEWYEQPLLYSRLIKPVDEDKDNLEIQGLVSSIIRLILQTKGPKPWYRVNLFSSLIERIVFEKPQGSNSQVAQCTIVFALIEDIDDFVSDKYLRDLLFSMFHDYNDDLVYLPIYGFLEKVQQDLFVDRKLLDGLFTNIKVWGEDRCNFTPEGPNEFDLEMVIRVILDQWELESPRVKNSVKNLHGFILNNEVFPKDLQNYLLRSLIYISNGQTTNTNDPIKVDLFLNKAFSDDLIFNSGLKWFNQLRIDDKRKYQLRARRLLLPSLRSQEIEDDSYPYAYFARTLMRFHSQEQSIFLKEYLANRYISIIEQYLTLVAYIITVELRDRGFQNTLVSEMNNQISNGREFRKSFGHLKNLFVDLLKRKRKRYRELGHLGQIIHGKLNSFEFLEQLDLINRYRNKRAHNKYVDVETLLHHCSRFFTKLSMIAPYLDLYFVYELETNLNPLSGIDYYRLYQLKGYNLDFFETIQKTSLDTRLQQDHLYVNTDDEFLILFPWVKYVNCTTCQTLKLFLLDGINTETTRYLGIANCGHIVEDESITDIIDRF